MQTVIDYDIIVGSITDPTLGEKRASPNKSLQLSAKVHL